MQALVTLVVLNTDTSALLAGARRFVEAFLILCRKLSEDEFFGWDFGIVGNGDIC